MTMSGHSYFPATLDEAKKAVEKNYLGVAGIHGVGKKASRNAVLIYAHVDSDQLQSLLGMIRQLCGPFSLELIIEEKPTIGSGCDG